MPDISIQFHAAPGELLPFVKGIVEDFGLHICMIKAFPFSVEEIELIKLLEGEVSVYLDCKHLVFTLTKPNLSGADQLEFINQNPEQMLLDVGKMIPKGLEQSWLAARTSDPSVLGVWKAVAKRLKGMTSAGATTVNQINGATGKSRSHRYTEGAKALQLQGVNMVSLTGTTIFKFG